MDGGRHDVDQRLAVLAGHLDRVEGAPAAAAVGRVLPRDRGSKALVRAANERVHDLAGNGSGLRGGRDRAAHLVQGDDVERRTDATGSAGGPPPDEVVERYCSNRGGVLQFGRVRAEGICRNLLPSILGRRPLLERAAVHLHDGEPLGLTQDVRRLQLDGPARGVEHHRPLPVDRDLQARRGALEPGAVLGRCREVVRAAGKPRRFEQPLARVGIALNLTCEHAVDRYAHQPTGLRSTTDRGPADDRLPVVLHAGIRRARKADRRRRGRLGHDLHLQRLGELSSLALSVERTDGDLVSPRIESLPGRQRVLPIAIDDGHLVDPHSVYTNRHLARCSHHIAAKSGRPVVGPFVCARCPGVALIREVGERCRHAGVEHRPRLELLGAELRAGCLAAAAAAGTRGRLRAGKPVAHGDQGG